jgi:hypothetical protein
LRRRSPRRPRSADATARSSRRRRRGGAGGHRAGGRRQAPDEPIALRVPRHFRDGNYAAEESPLALAQIARTGANYVALIPTHFSATYRDHRYYRSANTESDESLLAAFRAARNAGLAVMLKPHVDSVDGKPREYLDPSDVAAWFESYGALLLHYARIAAAERAEMLCIGCELDRLVGAAHRERWLRLIATIRAAYGGPLTYAATWNGAKDVSFWDAVDHVGVDAYNPLSNASDPSVEDLAAGWSVVPEDSWVASKSEGLSPLEFYRSLARRNGKPMLFTEIGYKSVAGAAARPGDWRLEGKLDLELQARAYEAFFRVWSAEAAWMRGAFLWHWTTKPNPSERSRRDYTPQHKPAADTITSWYRE